uniref:Uncharacterized protein n=1 Tax=viral metagenome TaxID=1070528 RepID=A0A6C0IVJ2_9ZZZZ
MTTRTIIHSGTGFIGDTRVMPTSFGQTSINHTAWLGSTTRPTSISNNYGYGCVVIGPGATSTLANNTFSTSVGYMTNQGSNGGVSIGAKISGNGSKLAIGYGCTMNTTRFTIASQSLLFGCEIGNTINLNNVGTGTHNVIIGYNAGSITGVNGHRTCVGGYANSYGTGSNSSYVVVVGCNSNAKLRYHCVLLGHEIVCNGATATSHNLLIGRQAYSSHATSTSTTVIGYKATSNATNQLAINVSGTTSTTFRASLVSNTQGTGVQPKTGPQKFLQVNINPTATFNMTGTSRVIQLYDP